MAFVGMVVLVVVSVVVLAVECCRVCDSGRVRASSGVYWFLLCPVVVDYAVEHAGVVTWLRCLLALVVKASALRS